MATTSGSSSFHDTLGEPHLERPKSVVTWLGPLVPSCVQILTVRTEGQLAGQWSEAHPQETMLLQAFLMESTKELVYTHYSQCL